MRIRSFVSTLSFVALLSSAFSIGCGQAADPPTGEEMRASIHTDASGRLTSIVGPLSPVDHVPASLATKLGHDPSTEMMKCIGGCDGQWCCTCCGSYCECGIEVDARKVGESDR